MLLTRAMSLPARTGRLRAPRVRSAFSLIDLLVSMVVVAVLIGIMIPSLSNVREAARRVVCASNVRQIGLGVAMYAEDYSGKLPPSKFAQSLGDSSFFPQQMMILRISDGSDYWDGLGQLFVAGYLDAPGVFYCPSHRGAHPYPKYAGLWGGEEGEIVGNYQMRALSTGSLVSSNVQAVLTDGLRSQADYNHRIGSNVLRTDMTVTWFSDPAGQVAARLPEQENDPGGAAAVTDAWGQIDQGSGARMRAPQ